MFDYFIGTILDTYFHYICSYSDIFVILVFFFFQLKFIQTKITKFEQTFIPQQYLRSGFKYFFSDSCLNSRIFQQKLVVIKQPYTENALIITKKKHLPQKNNYPFNK